MKFKAGFTSSIVEKLLSLSRKPVIFVISVLLIFGAFFSTFAFVPPAKKAQANADTVYIHYADNTAGAQIADVYQEMGGSIGVKERWCRWRFMQYVGGAGAWEPNFVSCGWIAAPVFETGRDDFVYTNGAGDGGSWVNYSIGNIVAKRRDTAAGYVIWSAYATYTVGADYDYAFLGVHHNSGVNGTIRVRINGVAATGENLSAGGLYDLAAHGADNVNPAWIHIADNIEVGDVITVECSDDLVRVRHTIQGLRFYNDPISTVPGDAGWSYLVPRVIERTNSSQVVAIAGNLLAQAPSFMWGVAHPNHEHTAALNLTMDGIPVTLGGSLPLNGVVSGDVLSIVETSTPYGNATPADDFGTLTRTFTWQGNVHTQAWRVALTKAFTVITAYATMWPAAPDTGVQFRYAELGNDFVVRLSNAGAGITGGSTSLAVPFPTQAYYGGANSLRLALSTTATVTENFIETDTNKQKGYLRVAGLERAYNIGETISGGVATFILTHEAPTDVDWGGGKTLYFAQSATIDNATDLIPFSGYETVVKSQAGAGIALTFSGVAPARTHFTSQDDDTVGVEEAYSDHSPAKGDWTGITVDGAVNAANNIVNYATTGMTLTGNANAYNNSLNQNTTGINAAAGSTVKNNALTNQTTYTTGAGSFDYDAFVGNAEAHAVNANPLFTNAAGGDFSLQSTSPAIDAGYDTGITTDYVGNTRRDDFLVANTGGGANPWYDIGAYEYINPLAAVPSAPTVNATSTTSLTVIININGNPDTTEYAISCDGDTTFLNYSTNACEAIADDANHWRTYANWGGAGGFIDTGLSANTQHTYKAKARNGDHVETALSGSTSKYTFANSSLAPPPTHLTTELQKSLKAADIEYKEAVNKASKEFLAAIKAAKTAKERRDAIGAYNRVIHEAYLKMAARRQAAIKAYLANLANLAREHQSLMAIYKQTLKSAATQYRDNNQKATNEYLSSLKSPKTRTERVNIARDYNQKIIQTKKDFQAAIAAALKSYLAGLRALYL